MDKKIENYLHLYGTGCEIITPDGPGEVIGIFPYAVKVHLKSKTPGQKMVGIMQHGIGGLHYTYLFKNGGLSLPLRPLSDMTADELYEIECIRNEKDLSNLGATHAEMVINSHKCMAEITAYMLKQGFDLFRLIESGLAISKVEVSNPLKTE